MNMREFAKDITLQEGGKVNMNIAQVSEVIKLVMTELATMDDEDIIKAVNRYRK
jgi:hypothetical protein